MSEFRKFVGLRISTQPGAVPTAAQNADAFDPAGSANNAVNAHTEAADPHTQYVKKEAGKGLSDRNYTQTEEDKLSAVGSMANRNVYISDQPPDDAVGQDGDIWLQHWS